MTGLNEVCAPMKRGWPALAEFLQRAAICEAGTELAGFPAVRNSFDVWEPKWGRADLRSRERRCDRLSRGGPLFYLLKPGHQEGPADIHPRGDSHQLTAADNRQIPELVFFHYRHGLNQ